MAALSCALPWTARQPSCSVARWSPAEVRGCCASRSPASYGGGAEEEEEHALTRVSTSAPECLLLEKKKTFPSKRVRKRRRNQNIFGEQNIFSSHTRAHTSMDSIMNVRAIMKCRKFIPPTTSLQRMKSRILSVALVYDGGASSKTRFRVEMRKGSIN